MNNSKTPFLTNIQVKFEPHLRRKSNDNKRSQIFKKVKSNLVKIWKELSDNGRANLLKRRLDEEKVIENPDREIDNLMRKFSLSDTNFYQTNRLDNRRKTFSVGPKSKKLIYMLRKECNRAMKMREMEINKAKTKINLVNQKLSKLRIIKQGNFMKNRNQNFRKLSRSEAYHDKELEKKRRNYLRKIIYNELDDAEIAHREETKRRSFLKKEIEDKFREKEKRLTKSRLMIRQRKQVLMKMTN